jgi:hypothetical protein
VEVVLQVGSSKNGVGAVLLQDGKPVEFASRALRQSERNWAQIEKKALSMLYGHERFDQYAYGRKVIVDCKLASFSVAFLTSRSLASGKLSNAFTFMIRGRCSQSSSLSLHMNALLNTSATIKLTH